MDDDTQAIAIGLGAGLGGFAALLIIGCICWQIVCGSWCEKKSVHSTTIPVHVRNQRRPTTVAGGTKVHNSISTITPMKTTNIYPNSKSTASNDLASKVNPTRR